MTPKTKRSPLVQSPFYCSDGQRWWLCRLDAKHRLKIPWEIVEEQDWRDGDMVDLDVEEKDGSWTLLIRNHQALARRAARTAEEAP